MLVPFTRVLLSRLNRLPRPHLLAPSRWTQTIRAYQKLTCSRSHSWKMAKLTFNPGSSVCAFNHRFVWELFCGPPSHPAHTAEATACSVWPSAGSQGSTPAVSPAPWPGFSASLQASGVGRSSSSLGFRLLPTTSALFPTSPLPQPHLQLLGDTLSLLIQSAEVSSNGEAEEGRAQVGDIIREGATLRLTSSSFSPAFPLLRGLPAGQSKLGRLQGVRWLFPAVTLEGNPPALNVSLTVLWPPPPMLVKCTSSLAPEMCQACPGWQGAG